MRKFKLKVKEPFIEVIVCEHTNINIQLLKKLYRILQGNRTTMMIKFESFVCIEKEAREFIHRIEKGVSTRNFAVVAQTFNDSLQANYYNKFYKPVFPIKIFRSEKDVETWYKSTT